jgi:glycine dehydrogenase subunit 2
MNYEKTSTGIQFNEPLLWEKSVKNRSKDLFIESDVKDFNIEGSLIENELNLPELSELDVVRHFTRLSQLNFSIDSNFYPLGSCTMKYNPKINESIASLDGFTFSHPLIKEKYVQGCLHVMYHMQEILKALTGLDAATLQPAAGAHGEFTGMLLIHKFNKVKGLKKTKIIIPDSAHGTNPASAAICGFSPISVKSNENGIIDASSIEKIMDENVAGIIITNPNTLGFFEENLKEIAEIIHSKGGLVYCDGANLNAILGIVNFKKMGVDILHINLHKTFATPHGGGGPGAGPLCVRDILEPYLPKPIIKKKKEKFVLDYNRPDSIGKIHSFYGNFNIIIRAYCYILSMGKDNIKKIAQMSVLNANYIKEKLKPYFKLPYDRNCMHECVFNDELQRKNGITTMDIAKKLIDFGIHPPTVYFPLIVKNALMIEPTETESKQTLDIFIDAMRKIAKLAEENPEELKTAPQLSRTKRVDEVLAARKPILKG